MKKKNGMKIRILKNKIIVFMLLIVFFSSSDLFSQEEDKKIAGLYLSTADSFYNSSDIMKAEVFLNKSLLYYKDSSDAYYLKSLIEEKKGLNTEIIISSLKKALVFRNWNIYSEEEAFYRLGMLYSSIKEYRKAVSTLYVIESEKIDDENYLEAYTNSLLNSGMFETASEILKTAVEKYPDNSSFRKKLINTDSDYYNSLLLKILDKNEVYDFKPETIIEVLKNTEDEGIKKELFEKVEEYSDRYPELIIEKIKIEKKAEENDISRFFDSRGYESLRLLKELRNILEDRQLRDFFDMKISNLNTVIHDDLNSDGESEIIFRVENGIPVWYREDFNQDGLNDIYIFYNSGNIETIEYGEKYFVKYYNYPLLENIIIITDSIDLYDFSNKNTILDAVENEELFDLPVIDRELTKKINKILVKASIHQKNNPESNLRIMEYLKNSRIKMYSEVKDEQTIAEGIIKDGKYRFINRDYNSENSFETKEIYRDGKLSAILYDGDNDGIFEIKVENDTKYFDYNNDGRYDSFIRRSGDEVYKGYSTELNGVFDIEEKSCNGKIISVRKGSSWNDVYFDSVNKIYWIGKIPENISIERIKDKSYLTIGNRQIYIFKIDDNFYAEVIN